MLLQFVDGHPVVCYMQWEDRKKSIRKGIQEALPDRSVIKDDGGKQ